MSPEKKYVSKSRNHKAELYYWSGEFPIYIDKVKNQPPDLTAGEFNRGE